MVDVGVWLLLFFKAVKSVEGAVMWLLTYVLSVKKPTFGYRLNRFFLWCTVKVTHQNNRKVFLNLVNLPYEKSGTILSGLYSHMIIMGVYYQNFPPVFFTF